VPTARSKAWSLAWRDPFVMAMFFSLLLIGGDRIAIKVGGLTLRVVFPLLMTASGFLFMQIGGRIKILRSLCWLFTALALAGAISIFGTYDVTKSIGYTIWVLFDFFVIITLCYNLARRAPSEDILFLWFLIYRVHVVFILLEVADNFLHHRVIRPQIWFYESSYLSIFMSAYFGAALYVWLREGRRYRLDFALSMIGVLATSAASGLFGMLLAIVLNFILARQRVMLLAASVGLICLFVGILWLFFQQSQYYDLMVGFLLNRNFSIGTILDRGGDRYIRVLIGWDAFLRHPWTGIGIGADSTYMHSVPFPADAAQLMRPWMTAEAGEPFCNIIVEVLGTMGILGFIPFFGVLCYAVWSMWRLARDPRVFDPAAMAFFVGFFSTFLALQLEGTFLRYYLWAPLGLALGAMARRRQVLG
jgi:O-antigen ligase